MRVDVTQEDIDKGRPCSEEFCPVALAIKRKRGVHEVRVSGVRTTVAKNRYDFAMYELPASAWEWIEAFDDGGQVNKGPFSFRMRRVN